VSLRVFAHGGGVQSTAALVLSAQGEIDFPVHLFSNVGDDSEHPATLKYVREVSMPYAEAHGVELREVHRIRRNGERDTLLGQLHRAKRSIDIPVRMADTGSPGNRKCTQVFKLDVLRKCGADVLGIGFTVDEIHRVGRVHGPQVREFPLVDLGLRRSDCHTVIESAGLPVPPKSACYFCPFKRPQQFAEMRRDEPQLFDKAADLEDLLNERREMLGKDRVYLTRFGRPLRECIGPAQETLFDQSPDIDTCDEGVCFV
jgi:hypothetical protein